MNCCAMKIRPAEARDMDAILEINARAFGQPGEGQLVKALWNRVHPSISLVAELEDRLVGHILFSPVWVEGPEPAGTRFRAIALGPMSVDPPHQNRGIGSALVRAGLEACRSERELVVFVLGHPRYYPRFGFRPAASQGIGCEFPVPDDVFLVQELEPGALGGRTGTVRYHPEFHKV
jgi:putative acetyltransferase